MKSKANYLIILLLLIISSCSIQKRVHQNGYHVQFGSKIKSSQELQNSEASAKKSFQQKADKRKETYSTEDLTILNASNTAPKDSSKCDLIIKRNGDEIYARIISHEADAIVYSLCLETLSNDYYLRNKDIFMIKYRNGTKKVFNTEPKQANPTPVVADQVEPEKVQPERQPAYQAAPQKYNVKKVTDPLAVLSFILSILSFFIFGILFGIAAVVLGITSMSRIASRPDEFKGGTFAILGIILGLTAIMLVALYLPTL